VEYQCDKSFTDIKNGIIQMKFILKEDELKINDELGI
jgi:hypothetical protein